MDRRAAFLVARDGGRVLMCEGKSAYEAGWRDACDITDELLKSFTEENEGWRQQVIRLREQIDALTSGGESAS